MNRLIEDLSVLTTIPEKHLEKLKDKTYYIITETILEHIIEEKSVAEIDIGIGVLYIQILENSIKYKFIPNNELEKYVREVVKDKKSVLINTLETNLVEKISKVYKDLM